MAVYSFFKWKRKKSGGEEIMKKMTPAWIVGLCVLMALLGVGSYFALGKLGGSAVITDTIFFVFSVTACLLLAGCFKNAYILTLLSGLGGTALWLYQLINQGVGLSVAVFYIIVSINSIIAVYQQYFSKKHRGA